MADKLIGIPIAILSDLAIGTDLLALLTAGLVGTNMIFNRGGRETNVRETSHQDVQDRLSQYQYDVLN
jgi:hypothetical protein